MTSCAFPDNQDNQWQKSLATAFTQVDQLLDFLKISHIPDDMKLDKQNGFPIRVPHYFASLMEPGNIHDPLLRQVLPLAIETQEIDGYSNDPVGDLASANCSVLKKYNNRALIVTTGACAIHCRYCFRRNFPYEQHQLRDTELPDIIHSVKDTTEVILSGGDPLCLSDNRLKLLFSALAKLPKVKRIRIHSRLPIVLPQRITPALVKILTSTDKQLTLVVHSNHPNELSESTTKAIRLIRQENEITVLNQSVLLKNINDQAEILIKLSEKLFEIGILPYYLHYMDAVQGAAHFTTSKNAAFELEKQLQDNLPGYLVPKLVIEIAGATAKQPLTQVIQGDSGHIM